MDEAKRLWWEQIKAGIPVFAPETKPKPIKTGAAATGSPNDQKAVTIASRFLGIAIGDTAIYGDENLCKQIGLRTGLTLSRETLGKGISKNKYWVARKDGEEIYAFSGCSSSDDGKTHCAIYAAAFFAQPNWRSHD